MLVRFSVKNLKTMESLLKNFFPELCPIFVLQKLEKTLNSFFHVKHNKFQIIAKIFFQLFQQVY